MSAPGDISRSRELVEPDVATITSCAAAHLESSQSVDAIADAKAEILEGCARAGRRS